MMISAERRFNARAAKLLVMALTSLVVGTLSAERIYLSGTAREDAKMWDFKVSEGRKSGEWHQIPVPSNWEQEGFGSYDYGYTKPEEKHDEIGFYRTTFTIPEKYKENHYVRIVFEGAMTMTSVKIDGKLVGEPNQGGYNRFSYPLSLRGRMLKYGKEQKLEVEVAKRPDNESLDLAERKADYWVFGGIYRPVYLEILPLEFIDRMAIDARHDGNMKVDVFTQMHSGYGKKMNSWVDEIRLQVETLDGKPVGPVKKTRIPKATAMTSMQMQVEGMDPWSTEHPNLYRLRAGLYREGELVHEKLERFGFRTFEVRPGEGFFLNGEHIMAKGINRNGFHPDTGRALTTEKNRRDAEMIKAMNANLVRSHLPPDRSFVDRCNELGILLVIEVTQWQSPAIDTQLLRDLVFESVTSFQNDPSVIFWANGNEGGFNLEVDQLFNLFDLQKRQILHPWAQFGEIYTYHYANYGRAKELLESNKEIYFPTEILHGVYDGGHGAGLKEFWDLMREYPQGAGMVLWCWADAAIRRTDKEGILDTDGNHSADGIVGPYGELEASYFTVREVWSPIQIPMEKLPENFDGRLPVENHFSFTDLKDCRFEWEILHWEHPGKWGEDGELAERGSARFLPDPEGKNGTLVIPSEALDKGQILSLRAYDSHSSERMHWQWSLGFDTKFELENTAPTLTRGETLRVSHDGADWEFKPGDAQLLRLTSKGVDTSLSNGPKLYLSKGYDTFIPEMDWDVEAVQSADKVTITAKANTGAHFTWSFEAGSPACLDYDFGTFENPTAYAALGFDLPDDVMKSKRWLGLGPYPVWENRMEGPQMNVWENEYNEGAAGFNWEFPEFKGTFGEVSWMQFKLKSDRTLTIQPSSPIAMGVSRPVPAPFPVREKPAYPESGGLFLFHDAPGIGDKMTIIMRYSPLSGFKPVSEPISGRVQFHCR